MVRGYLRRVSGVRLCRRGRSERRREGVCPHPAVPGDPHRSPRNPSARSGPCSGAARRGGRCSKRSAPGYFLSLSDEASAEIASKLCGQVAKIKSSVHHQRNRAKSSGINLMSAQAGGGRGSVGASKSFQRAARGALSAARLRPTRATVRRSVSRTTACNHSRRRRVYLKPHYLPRRPPVLGRESRPEQL